LSCAFGAHGEDLVVAHAVAARRRPCRGGRSTCAFHHHRALCADPARVWVATHGPAPRVLGHAPRPASPAGEPCKQASKSAVALGPVPISARWPGNFKKMIFYFFFRFQAEFKIQKFVSKYLELQKLRNQFRWIHNFLIHPIKLFRKT
jgi:hypothetical protein